MSGMRVPGDDIFGNLMFAGIGGADGINQDIGIERE